MKAQRSENSAQRQILMAVASILLGEMAIMLVIGELPPMPRWRETLLDTGLLAIPVLSGLYFFVYRGLMAHLSEATRTSSQAHGREVHNLELFAANPHPMWFFDAETLSFLAVNDAAVAHYGYRRDEFLAMTIADIRPAEDMQHLSDSLVRVAANPSVDLVGARHRKKDGTLIDVEITSHPTEFRGRRARLVMVFDLTERKRAESAIESATKRLALHVAQTPLAIIEWDLDCHVVQWNPAAERIFGFTAAEAIGQHYSFILPEGVRPALEPVKQGLIQGRDGERRTNENVRKDGRVIVCEWYNTSLVDGDGKVVAAASQVGDITERVRAEAAAREASHLSEQIIREAREGVVLHGPDLRFQVWNQFMEQLSGLPASEVLNRHPLDVFPFLHGIGVMERLERALAGELPEAADFQYHFPRTGKSGWLSHMADPLRNTKGEIIGVIATLSDITDRKQADEELKKRNLFVESLLENAPIGFAVNQIDDGLPVFISRNFETIYGVAPNSITNVDEYFDTVYRDPVFRETMRERVMADMASGDPARMRWENVPITTQSGEQKFVTATNIPLPDQNLMISTVQDVTTRRRAEEALIESEKSLQDAQRLAHLGSWQWTMAPDRVYWSAELCDIMGHDPALPAPSFAQMSSYYTSESWKRLTETVEKTVLTGEPYALDLDVVRTDGAVRATHTHGAANRDASGKIIGLHGTVHDINERKESERAHRRLQQAADTSGEAIFITDVDGIIRYINPAFTTLYGFSADEVVGIVTPRILKSGRLDPEAYEYFWRTLLGGQEVRGETINRRKDGTIIAVDGSANAILDEAKRITGFLGIQRDASDRKKAEQSLRASEARYRAVAQSAHDAIVTADHTGTIVGWNGGAETIFGYTEAEAIGQPLSILIPAGHQALHFAGMNGVHAGAEQHVIGETVELEGVRKDGSEFPLELSLAQWESAEGMFVTGILRDITARVQEQAALRLQSAALNAAANPMVITDRDGSIEWVNEAFTTVTGFSADEAIGHELHVLLSWGAHDESFRAKLRETILTGAVWQGEVTSRRKDGSWYPEDVTLTPVKDALGNVTHCIAITRDLTDEKARHAQFLQAQKMESVGRLAGGIAHDFNNLLTVINNTADLAAANVREDDPIRADLEEIHRAGERAAALTAQLLSFSRKQIVKADIVHLSTLVSDMRPMLARLIGEDIQLVIAPSDGVGNVLADGGQLEQVVMNLVVNARDAMPTGGMLMIETRDVDLDEAFVAMHAPLRPGKHVALIVRDRGVGMDAATRQHIFEPFFTTKGQGQGTGLGLATVYGIVQQSGGSISVESELGQGTTFTIYLPRVDSEAAGPRVERTRKAIRGSETILIVEDDAALLRLSTRILRSAGYQVLMAAEGAEALRVLKDHHGPVDLLLTDVVMPGMGGRELAGRLADIRPEIKVLYTSGYTDDTILRHGVLEQTAHFISKPYKQTELTRKVRAVLDGPPNRPVKG